MSLLGWLLPAPQIVRVEVPAIQQPVTVHVAAPEPVPFERGTCETCVYWLPKAKASGECRRSAPVHADLSALGKPAAFWALTGAQSWCGEFRRV